jgi:hypothetical protein
MILPLAALVRSQLAFNGIRHKEKLLNSLAFAARMKIDARHGLCSFTEHATEFEP